MASFETNFTYTWTIFGVVDAEQMFKPRPTSLAFQLSPKLLYTLAHQKELRKYMHPQKLGTQGWSGAEICCRLWEDRVALSLSGSD